MHSVLQVVLLTVLVDPATYVGNVYGTAAPNATVTVWDGVRAVRTATAGADGKFLINNIPTPFDGRDYTVTSGGATITAHVLPGAAMALEVDLVQNKWNYRHEVQSGGPALEGQNTDIRPAEAGPPLSFSIFSTREGLVGGTTANGHVIVANDRFAALPSRRALSTNFGYEREVRLTYRGRTTTVPVWDIGPWNTHDDYWNPSIIRETFKDLPRGTPEAEAAFAAGYNGGLDERGRRVLTPAGIDLADGTFWLDLAMTNNDRVQVEYLWLDQNGPLVWSIGASTAFVTARVNDTTTGNSPIAGAEMFVDRIGANGSGIAMTPIDGAFDSSDETVTAAVPAGTHVVYVHAVDAYGNWGPFSTVSIGSNVARRRSVRHS